MIFKNLKSIYRKMIWILPTLKSKSYYENK